jgi:hypothetical protein
MCGRYGTRYKWGWISRELILYGFNSRQTRLVQDFGAYLILFKPVWFSSFKLVQDAKKIFQYSHAKPIVFSHLLLGIFKENVVRKLATYLWCLIIAKKVSLFGTLWPVNRIRLSELCLWPSLWDCQKALQFLAMCPSQIWNTLKVVGPMCLLKSHVIEVYAGVKIVSYNLILASDGSDGSAVRPSYYTY